MTIMRTAVVKLSVPDNRRDDLKRTMNTFRDVTQRFADRGWEGNDDGYVITDSNRLQPLVYDDIRDGGQVKVDRSLRIRSDVFRHLAVVTFEIVE